MPESASSKRIILRNYTGESVRLSIISSLNCENERIIPLCQVNPYQATLVKLKCGATLRFLVSIANEPDCSAAEHTVAFNQSNQCELNLTAKSDEKDRKLLVLDSPESIKTKVIGFENLLSSKKLHTESNLIPRGYQILHPEQEYLIGRPVGFIDCVGSIESEQICKRLADEMVAYSSQFPLFSLKNAIIFSEQNLIVATSDHELLANNQYLPYLRKITAGLHFYTDGNSANICNPSVVKGISSVFDTPVLLLGNSLIGTYGHWLCDLFPRIMALKELENKVKVKLLLPHIDVVPPYVLDSLTAVGIEKECLIFADEVFRDGGYVQFSELLIPAFPDLMNNNNRPSPLLAQFYSGIRGAICGFSSESATRRIFVSRRLSNTRKISNEQELVELLARFGFETVYAEELSFEQKVRLFGSVKVIAGSMGSNLAHCVHMPSGGSVIEFCNDKYWFEGTRALPAIFGHQFYQIIGASVGNGRKQRLDSAFNLDCVLSFLNRHFC